MPCSRYTRLDGGLEPVLRIVSGSLLRGMIPLTSLAATATAALEKRGNETQSSPRDGGAYDVEMNGANRKA